MSGVDALNRIADALFAQAKAQRENVKLTERQVAVQEELLALQHVNLHVTKVLEQKLLEQASAGAG